MHSQKKLTNIPTHVFMGFLGSGKTSAILNLFQQKPAKERWAVLVNEYGKLGIDGAHYQSQGITVKEIPGGCMCCAAGVPMQVAINQLLRASRPDRLFIETSGLGHPGGVLKTLTGDHFKTVLSLKASICLVDPEKLLNPLMYSSGLFEQQIALADVLVANKVDLASDEAMSKFDALKETFMLTKLAIAKTSFGSMNAEWLTWDTVEGRDKDVVTLSIEGKPPQNVFVASEKFKKNMVFSLQELECLFAKLKPIRIKAICYTDNGWVLLSGEAQQLSVAQIASQQESWFDVILSSKKSQEELVNMLDNAVLNKGT